MAMKSENGPIYATKSDYDYLARRIEDLWKANQDYKKMIRLLVRILVDKKIIGEELAKTFEEAKEEKHSSDSKEVSPKILEWYEAKLWIQQAIKHKGALRAQLGVKEDETIPKSVLQAIVNAETGSSISFRGKSIKVTTQLKRRALLALRLGKMPKRGD